MNVDDQRADPDSLLNWVSRAVGIRQEHSAFGRGRAAFLDAAAAEVVCHRIDGRRDVLAVHNLADEGRRATPDVDERPVPLFADGRSDLVSTEPLELDLDGYGYVWFRLGSLQP